jgi:hypothetical protein
MEIGPQKIVHKLLRLLVLGPARLIFENHIIVPPIGILADKPHLRRCIWMRHVPSLDVKVLCIQKRVPSRNVKLSLLLVFGGIFSFLQ